MKKHLRTVPLTTSGQNSCFETRIRVQVSFILLHPKSCSSCVWKERILLISMLISFLCDCGNNKTRLFSCDTSNLINTMSKFQMRIIQIQEEQFLENFTIQLVQWKYQRRKFFIALIKGNRHYLGSAIPAFYDRGATYRSAAIELHDPIGFIKYYLCTLINVISLNVF